MHTAPQWALDCRPGLGGLERFTDQQSSLFVIQSTVMHRNLNVLNDL